MAWILDQIRTAVIVHRSDNPKSRMTVYLGLAELEAVLALGPEDVGSELAGQIVLGGRSAVRTLYGAGVTWTDKESELRVEIAPPMTLKASF